MIIAEIGTSHGGSLRKAKELILAAKDAGADAVKFQWVYAHEILHPLTGKVQLPTGNIPLYERFKQLEVTPDFFESLCAFAHEQKLHFTCSPFGLQSLHELLAIHPDSIKIASPELNHYPLLQALAEYRKNQQDQGQEPIPVILSTGVSKLQDIEQALAILGTTHVTVLHCITCYPAPESEYNIRVLKSLHEIFGVSVGISDHSLDPILVPTLAALMGGITTEKHITLSKQTDGLDDPVALEPEQFALMSHCIRQTQAAINRYGIETATKRVISQLQESYSLEKIEAVLGSGIKQLAPSEYANYGRTNRSLHFMRAMRSGEVITDSDIAVLRTEKILTPGISPLYLDTIIGSKLARDVEDGAGVQWQDLLYK
ncbi:MAG: N-acetylneuraminate synthase family protein [Treponema sp.]|nr:N-acetylneuraminate synthase family protein [Treponema sp.]